MYKALVSIDNHLVKLPNGEFRSLNIVDRSFWNRYLDYFDSVTVLVRAEEVEYSSKYDNYHVVNHPRVTIKPVPMFRSIKQLLKSRKDIFHEVKNTINSADYDISIIRLPSLLGYIVFYFLRKAKQSKPVGVEVVADMSVGSRYSSIFSRFKTFVFHILLKFYVKKADGAAYVTKYALQEKYPSKHKAVTNNYSSIDLDMSYFFKKTEKDLDFSNKMVNILHVSTLNTTSKGHEIFIETIKTLRENGYEVKGTIVGGGSQKEYYENIAVELGIEKYLDFIGSVSHKEDLREIYIKSDLLLFPSEFEGLPRTVIEAMACSLPVVASNAGGISELIDSYYVSDPYDKEFYYNRIKELIDRPDYVIKESKNNYSNSLSYESSNLQERRNDFFDELIGSKLK